MRLILLLLGITLSMNIVAQPENPLYKLDYTETYIGWEGIPSVVLVEKDILDLDSIELEAAIFLTDRDTTPAYFLEPYEQDGVTSVDSVVYYTYLDLLVQIEYFLFVEFNPLYEEQVMIIAIMPE